MRRFAFVAVAVVVGLLASSSVFSTGSANAADDAQALASADKALTDALARGDRKAAAALLGASFSWTDAEGTIRTRAQVLANLSALAAESKDESDLQTHVYGQLGTIRGAHDSKRFLRIWAKRLRGWRAVLLLDTPVARKTGQAAVEAAAGQGDCDNPCRRVPYKPRTPIDKAILAAWQKTKMTEWKPDPAEWARYIADEFMIINNTTLRNKAERVAIVKKQQDAGVGAPGDPIMSMQILNFGRNAAVMISQHFPYRGGKPYRNVGIWVLRDNRWQLAISQQATIQSAARLPAVASK